VNKQWDLIHTQHHHNNHTTTPYMRVGPSVWGPLSCEGLLCGCCIGVVNLTFSNILYPFLYKLYQIVLRKGEGTAGVYSPYIHIQLGFIHHCNSPVHIGKR